MSYFQSGQMLTNVVNSVPGQYNECIVTQPILSNPPSGYCVNPYTNEIPVINPALVGRDQFGQLYYPSYVGHVVHPQQQQPLCQPNLPMTIQPPPLGLLPYNPSIPPPYHVAPLPPNNHMNSVAVFPRLELSNGIAVRNVLKDGGTQTSGQAIPDRRRYESDDSGIAKSPCSLPPVPVAVPNREEGVVSKQQLPDPDETYWTIAEDDQFWGNVRFRPPTNYVMTAIANQVDYYLSDDYLSKDKYLLRQIRCKKDGYISVKLITSFKKIKKLTKDWAVVRSAIVRKSNSVVVSLEGLRIRRCKDLSEELRKPRLITSILVIRLPEDYSSVESVTSLFRGFGEINLVRLLRADKEVPAELRNYATQVEDIGKSLCAVVDFESSENALLAVKVLKHFQRQNKSTSSSQEDTSHDKADESLDSIAEYIETLKEKPSLDDMRLALLGPRVRRTLYKQDKAASQQFDGSVINEIGKQYAKDDKTTSKKLAHSSVGKEKTCSSNVLVPATPAPSGDKPTSSVKLDCSQPNALSGNQKDQKRTTKDFE